MLERLIERLLAPILRLLAAVDARLRAYLLYRVAVAVVRLFRARHGVQRAGEISFYAILSVIPFGALMIWLLSFVYLDLLGGGWSHEEIVRSIDALAPELMPGSSTSLETVIQGLLEVRGSLGVFGTLAMLISASLVFGGVNRALAAIFDVRPRGRLSSAFLVSVLGSAVALLLLLGLGVLSGVDAAGATGTTSSLQDTLQRNALLVDFGSSALIALGFAGLLKVVVKAPVPLWVALGGGLFFVLAFEAARFTYSLYLDNVARLNVVYGSLAGTMATLLWIFYVMLMFLVAACLTRVVHDRLYDRLSEEDAVKPGRRWGGLVRS